LFQEVIETHLNFFRLSRSSGLLFGLCRLRGLFFDLFLSVVLNRRLGDAIAPP